MKCFRCDRWPCECADGCTIIHGDCREVLPQIEVVDMVLTDPPYGHNNNNNNDLIARWELALGVSVVASETRPIANDGAEANELVRWNFNEWRRLLKPGCCCCCCCCCGGGGPDPQFARWSLWLDESLDFKQMVVWDKGPMGMGWHYRRSYETVLVAQKPGAACKWFDKTDAVENIIRPNGMAPKILPSKDQHPTEKPVGLFARFIELHSQPGDSVLDPFVGSGSTLIACKLSKRRGIGIEIDERWCERAAERLRQEVLFP